MMRQWFYDNMEWIEGGVPFVIVAAFGIFIFLYWQ